MTGYPSAEPRLCWLGRAAQKVGCLPTKFVATTPLYYPIAIHTVDGDSGYSDDIKYKPGPRLPPPQPDEPKLQMTPYTAAYQYQYPHVSKTQKKTPVARTVPLSTLPLPVNALPVYTPPATCVTLNANLPPVHPTVQITHTPYLAPLPAIPGTPHQNTLPNSILQDLGNIAPTQYIWNTPHGALTYTPAPASHLLLPNPLADPDPRSPRIVDVGDGGDGVTGPGLVPSPIPSGSSSDYSDSDYRSEIVLHSLLASNYLPTGETPIEWKVSDPADMARHIVDNASFLASAGAPATNPPMTTLRIDFRFIDQPEVQWNWEPITMRKPSPIRITDVLHAIHDYFQVQLTHSEYNIIKSFGRRNAKIVANSWSDRVAAEMDSEAQTAIYYGGLRRVDCLGSSKNFAGLWFEGSQLKLGLRS